MNNKEKIVKRLNQIFQYATIAFFMLVWLFGMYDCGMMDEKEDIEKSRALTEKENTKVYLDVINVLHSDKDCYDLVSSLDSIDVERKEEVSIDKNTVDREFLDTVFICVKCVLNQEYDDLYNRYHRKKIDISQSRKFFLGDK